MISFNKLPFVRVLLPFVLGILANLYLNINGPTFIVIICLVAFSSIFVFKTRQTKFIIIPILIIFDSALFLYGVELTKRFHLDKQEDYFARSININSEVFWVAQINDIPVNKARSIKVDLKVIGVRKDSDYVASRGNVIAYFQKSKVASDLSPGKFVLIRNQLMEVESPKNPNAFDFKNYLADKNIFHTSYVDSSSFTIIPLSNSFSVWQLGLQIKHSIIKRLGEIGLSINARSICTALITGFDDDIDKEVLEAFSHSGTLHVLSVSGLHVGLIYLILNYLMGLVDRNKKYKLLQFIFISFCLWFFALITGFSAPVLRSVIMFNLLGLGNLYFRNKSFNQINILAVSAFALLIIDPLWIRDIGFLLSYSALFGIIYFNPRISKLFEPSNKFIKKIWESIVVSFSATLTTLPITLFVFHQFPIWFALANLVVVPLSFILLLLSFAALLKIGIITWLVNALNAFMVSFISLFQSEGWTFVDYIDFNFTDAVGTTLVIFFITALFIKRSYAYVFSLMITIITWQILSLGNSYNSKTKKEVVIYQTPEASTLSLKNSNTTVLSNFDTLHYTMSIKPNVISYNYTNRKIISFNYLKNEDINLMILSRNDSIPHSLQGLTHMLICNNSVPQKSFLENNRPKVLIADGSNSYWAIRKLERLCEEFQIRFHSTRDKGAFILTL